MARLLAVLIVGMIVGGGIATMAAFRLWAPPPPQRYEVWAWSDGEQSLVLTVDVKSGRPEIISINSNGAEMVRARRILGPG